MMYGQEIGLYYGFNGSVLSGDQPKGIRIKPERGFAVGLYADFRIAEGVDLSLQPGIQQVKSTVRFSSQQGEKDSLSLRMDYFALPVLVRIYPEKSNRFYFIGGPQFGLLRQSIAKDEFGNESDLKEITNDLIFSFNFGFGYRKRLGRFVLTGELRYEQGITNITQLEGQNALYSRIKLQGMNLTLKFGWPIKNE